MNCRGTASIPAQAVGHLIVYGIEGYQKDVSSNIYDALYIQENGEMAMQTDLSLNTHHIRDLAVDENDKTSAVSIKYLEEGGLKKTRDKIYYDLFVSFVDFRLPDTYSLIKNGPEYALSAKVRRVLLTRNRWHPLGWSWGAKFLVSNSIESVSRNFH